jgi:serine/threonine-protein kinase
VPSLTEVAPSLPPAIDDVIRRGMAKKPTDRYPTCRELIVAARQALTQPVRRPPAVPVGPRPGGPGPGGPGPGGPRMDRPPLQQTSPYQRQQSPSTPPGGYQRPQMSSADPVRLRPPVPAGASTAFTSSDSSGGTRWIAPVLVGVVAIGLIVAAILFFSSGGDPAPESPGGDTEQTTTTTKKTVPSIKVGDDSGDAGNSSATSGR